jgi:hypothetical protein
MAERYVRGCRRVLPLAAYIDSFAQWADEQGYVP